MLALCPGDAIHERITSPVDLWPIATFSPTPIRQTP
jgi:hypothetical protein